MRIFKAPEPIIDDQHPAVFLAGTIDMGSSVDWQSDVCKHFADTSFNIYNPRRDDWDSSWKQHIDHPEFNRQVNWELDAMGKADWIIMNFMPGSASPVTLLELGLFANSQKLMVCCPDDFYRSGNVQIVCKNYNIPLFKTINELLQSLKISTT